MLRQVNVHASTERSDRVSELIVPSTPTLEVDKRVRHPMATDWFSNARECPPAPNFGGDTIIFMSLCLKARTRERVPPKINKLGAMVKLSLLLSTKNNKTVRSSAERTVLLLVTSQYH